MENEKPYLLQTGKPSKSLPKNVSILAFFVNPTTFDPSVKPFLAYFPQKTESPPSKNLRVLF
jgi:hypothetical protein